MKRKTAPPSKPRPTKRARISRPVPTASRATSRGGELKFFDTALAFSYDATAEVATSNTTGQLDLIPQGVTESTRVGRKCVIKSIQIRGINVLIPAATAVAASSAYLWIVLDQQTNGAQAGFTDIFTTTVSHSTMLNLSNTGRFKIIKKFPMFFNSPAGVTTAYNNVGKNLEYFTKCNIPLEFSSTTGALTELRTNHLFLAYGASQDDLVAFAGTCRLRYED